MNQGIEFIIKNNFVETNKNFLDKHHLLLEYKVSERTLCGALAIEISKALENSWYFAYFVDIEYNRNHDMIKLLPKKYVSDDFTEGQQRIFPDIIVHSRGQRELDNLLVIEMKKADAYEEWKNIDRKRLMAMTMQNGLFKYRLGIFYIVDFARKQIQLEYYVNGELVGVDNENFVGV